MNGKEKNTILVVDDERSNIDALSYILKPTYSILVAKDGQTALEVAQKKNPDLILLDIVMPGISGFDTLSALKTSPLTQGIPVIFITGRDNAEDEGKGLALGAVDYITKPFHNSIVEARVRLHLQMIDYIRMIEHLCMIDTLTNLPNRRYFDNQLNAEWGRAARTGNPISLLMIDVDKFKDYNDTYGHLQGDHLLKTIATLFKEKPRRSTDLAARWGGEEFAVLLPDTDLCGALTVAENIRIDVENAVILCNDGRETRITISIGVSSWIPTRGQSSESLISDADSALYAAKNAERNKVMHMPVSHHTL